MNDGNLFHASREKATEIPRSSFLIFNKILHFLLVCVRIKKSTDTKGETLL